MKVSNVLIQKVKEFESLALNAYQDSKGVWTIGWGHTKGVKKGDRITEAQAEAYFRQDIAEYEDYVNGLQLNLTQGQFDALTDFAFNAGINALATSTLLKKVRAKAPTEEIQYEFSRWVYVTKNKKKIKLEGLVKRRQWEALRWAE